jgi:hypothetical protein
MDEALASTRAGHEAPGESSPLPTALLMQAARVVAGTLRSTCTERGGDVSWAAAAPRDDGADLYAGTLGVAVFLAAYARADGRTWARNLALRAIAPARRAATQDDAGHGASLGGLVGRGAQIYALVTIGRFLDESALHDEAHRLATAIAPRWIQADRSLDVVHGSAGLILALLSLGQNVRLRPQRILSACCVRLTARHRRPRPRRSASVDSGDPTPGSGVIPPSFAPASATQAAAPPIRPITTSPIIPRCSR